MKRLLRDHCKKIIALNNSNQEKGLCLFFKTVFIFSLLSVYLLIVANNQLILSGVRCNKNCLP
jgi:hypothetical protein